jgi:hypothetical protein
MSINKNTVRLGYNIIKGTEYSRLLQMRVFLTEQNNVMVKREELVVTTEYLLLQMRSCLNRESWQGLTVLIFLHVRCILYLRIKYLPLFVILCNIFQSKIPHFTVLKSTGD